MRETRAFSLHQPTIAKRQNDNERHNNGKKLFPLPIAFTLARARARISIVQRDKQAIYSSGAGHDRKAWFSIMFHGLRFELLCVQLSGNLNATRKYAMAMRHKNSVDDVVDRAYEIHRMS